MSNSTLALVISWRKLVEKASAASLRTWWSVTSLESCLTESRAICWVWGWVSLRDIVTKGETRAGSSVIGRGHGAFDVESFEATTSKALCLTLSSLLANKVQHWPIKVEAGSNDKLFSKTLSDCVIKFFLNLEGITTSVVLKVFKVKMAASSSKFNNCSPSSSTKAGLTIFLKLVDVKTYVINCRALNLSKHWIEC